MRLFAFYIAGFVGFFSRFGRYADLLLGGVVLSLGWMWGSRLTMACGVFSILAFVFDFNGFIQRRTMEFAKRKAAKRTSSQVARPARPARPSAAPSSKE